MSLDKHLPKLHQILNLFIEKGGSDLHLRPGQVYLRIKGELLPLTDIVLTDEEIKSFVYLIIKNPEQQKKFEINKEYDTAYDFGDIARFRVNIYYQRGRINIVIRYIPKKIPPKESLRLPDVIYKLAENTRGLILVTGPAGSGKSTTLASMIDYINSTRKAHIITIEDPIEFVHNDNQSIISQRELGTDTNSYAEALKYVMRQNPDVILIGEIRDLETMRSALTSAQLGHLVLSTLHTIDAVQTINRVIDMFPPHQQNQVRLQLADTLRGVIAQRLLPLKSGQGMVPAVEVLVVTPTVKQCIEEKTLSEISNIMKQGQYYGMQTFNQSLLSLFKDGLITLNDALLAATSPEDLMLAIKGIESSTTGFSAPEQIIERFSKK